MVVSVWVRGGEDYMDMEFKEFFFFFLNLFSLFFFCVLLWFDLLLPQKTVSS